MRAAVALGAVVVALAAAAPAAGEGGRIAVGLADGASAEGVAALVEVATGGVVDRSLAPLDAVVVAVEDEQAALARLAGVPGIAYLEPIEASRSLAFLPSDPLLYLQWYLGAIRAFEFWELRPELSAVKVAVIDSGIDATHPEFAGRIAATRSFVRSPATVDTIGHGTMVAGLIAASMDNAEGIAGVGFPVQLLIGKVVGAGGSITIEAEAKAIRWAADAGARVINLSLGGHRDPRRRDPENPPFDTYSALEQAAIEYAVGRGAVVVAATGNCQTSKCPYRYASYPAALPHVIGVGALSQDNTVPSFSNRDTVFNDLAAPGDGIVSTFPTALTEPGCLEGAYSVCALSSLRSGRGTSFAAPLVAASAALLFAQNPSLTASQVGALLQETAQDVGAPGRDSATGSGRVSVRDSIAALAAPLPPTDRYEVNDDVGERAHALPKRRKSIVLRATIDFFDDPSDVYRVYLREGQRLRARLRGLSGRPTLVLWRPETRAVREITLLTLRSGDVLAHEAGLDPRLSFRARRSGWHSVEVKAPKRGGGAYRLDVLR